MKRRLSRIIAIMLVLIIAVCNQSYSSWASDEDNNISEEIVSGDNEAEQSKIATDSDAEIEMINDVVTEENIEAETEKFYPAFIRLESADDVRVIVTASEGVFPEGATLSVNKVTDVEEENINQAVDAVRDDNVMVAQAYTFDIKVLDENGVEIQPTDGQTVNVSFAMDEVANQNLTADVYHIPEEDGNLVAEELNTTESGDIVTAVSDGFSYYTVEFTYDEKQYVMNGDTTVALSDILDYVGLTGEVSAVSVSDESLFSASNESGEWMVTAHQAFSTNEWMKVTIGGVEYEIVVTDATQVNISNGSVFNLGTEYTFSYSGDETNLFAVNGVSDSEFLKPGTTFKSEVTGTIGADGTITMEGNTYTLGSGYNAWKIGKRMEISSMITKYYYFFYRTNISIDPTYTAPTSKTITYSGFAQTLVNTGSVSKGGTMEYALGTDTSTIPTSGWSTTATTGKDVGTYYVWWRINETSGYNAVAASCLTSTIGQATNTWTTSAVKQDNWTYDGT